MKIDDIFQEMNRLHRQMSKEMGRTFESDKNRIGLGREFQLAPRHDVRTPLADVRETESSVVASFEVPGAKKEDIDVTVTHRGVEVKIKQESKREVKAEDRESTEVKSIQFYRRLLFPKPVDVEHAKATYMDGILHVEAPKIKRAVRKLPIQ